MHILLVAWTGNFHVDNTILLIKLEHNRKDFVLISLAARSALDKLRQKLLKQRLDQN